MASRLTQKRFKIIAIQTSLMIRLNLFRKWRQCLYLTVESTLTTSISWRRFQKWAGLVRSPPRTELGNQENKYPSVPKRNSKKVCSNTIALNCRPACLTQISCSAKSPKRQNLIRLVSQLLRRSTAKATAEIWALRSFLPKASSSHLRTKRKSSQSSLEKEQILRGQSCSTKNATSA